ncbi:hypothetical protein DPMN_050462 [Dreissena polymorpha]|uniref:Uncharacterized protein n=1 Tax=Dreissena polymorpha TaxID=45954 RepID=A0A9D4CHW5_DREPO|nr:hypothetical protein DPMN_050462 [Dreissena polymorpha]
MRDEEADKQYQFREAEDKEAADFISQRVQQNSNDSSGSSSTKHSNKRKAIGDSDGHTVKNLRAREMQNKTQFHLKISRLTS